MLYLSLLLLCAKSLSVYESVIFYSSNTPEALLQQFNSFLYKFELFPDENNLAFSALKEIEFEFAVDLTLNSKFFSVLDSFAETFDCIYFTITRCEEVFFSNWRYFLHSSENDEAQALAKLVEWLKIDEFSILSSNRHDNLVVSDALHELLPKKVFSFLKYDENISVSVSVDLIGRMIKAKGIKRLVIVDSGNSMENIQNSIIAKRINIAGSIVIMSCQSSYSMNIDGAIGILEAHTTGATSWETYEYLSIYNTITEILKSEKTLISDNLNAIFKNHKYSGNYSIINQHENQIKSIGTISSNIEFFDTLYFPGNTTSSTESISTVLNFWFANGTTEVYNLESYYLFSYFYNGAIYAVMRSNSLNEIPRFEITLYPTDCGTFFYDEAWYDNCFKTIVKVPAIAYLTSFWDMSAYGNLITLRRYGVFLPQISPFSQADFIDNKDLYPEFLKLSTSIGQYLTNGFMFMKALGFDSVVIFATDDLIFQEQYRSTVEYAQKVGIKISNPVEMQIFPSNYSRDDFEKYRDYFQAAKDTRCRFYVLTVWDRGLIWEGLYDIGLRKGDFITLSESALLTYLEGEEEQYLKKRIELVYGSFSVIYKEWNGDLGQQLKAEMTQIFPILNYMCMTYDTISVLKNSIQYMLSRGEDYEDPVTLAKTMRNGKLTGCLGSIYFDREGNSRGVAEFTIQQVLTKESDGTFDLIDVAYLDKFSSQFITIVKDITWADGGSLPPPSLRSISICPFDDYLVQKSNNGTYVLYSVCAIFALIALVSSFLSFRNYQKEIAPLKVKQIMTFADMVFLSYFLFQFFQLISQGPDQDSYKYLVNNFQILISLDFSLFFKLEFSKFWMLVNVVLIFSGIWIILCTIVIFRFEVVFESNYFCKKVKFLTELLLPILGHIGFLPIFSMLLNVFMCRFSISDSLTDSFLDQDCTTFCYRKTHKTYAICASIAIALYLPAAIYTRPLWEQTQYSLNIKTKPLYLIVLSMVQVVLVILNKTLKHYDQEIHGYVSSLIVFGFFMYTVLRNPYNYKRVKIMQATSLLMSFWGIITSSIFRNRVSLEVWIITEFIGFIVILIAGALIIVRYPNMLFSRKGRDISTLFLFQFCKNYEKYIRDPGSLNISHKSSIYKIDSSKELISTVK